jgi:hypothetical protein
MEKKDQGYLERNRIDELGMVQKLSKPVFGRGEKRWTSTSV